MTLMSRFKTAARKRAAFNRTVAALETMPVETAIDLGLFREDARGNARKAVYGG